jgi:hypothetical protein
MSAARSMRRLVGIIDAACSRPLTMYAENLEGVSAWRAYVGLSVRRALNSVPGKCTPRRLYAHVTSVYAALTPDVEFGPSGAYSDQRFESAVVFQQFGAGSHVQSGSVRKLERALASLKNE